MAAASFQENPALDREAVAQRGDFENFPRNRLLPACLERFEAW
jgi:hypothetical protein